MDETPPFTDILLRDVSGPVASALAREAKRHRRSRYEQIMVLLDQAAARIEAAEARRAAKAAQTQQETV